MVVNAVLGADGMSVFLFWLFVREELVGMSEQFIIRFEGRPGELTIGNMKKISGHVRGDTFATIIDHLSLEANPREAKIGTVTDAIQETIRLTPELLPFKTKGVLLAVSIYEPLERNRYRIAPVNQRIEGILDGGHNTLAIGMYILEKALEANEQKLSRKVKNWEEFKEEWKKNHDIIEEYLGQEKRNSGSPIDFLVPVELQVPADMNDTSGVQNFRDHLFDICESRNNNVELQLSAKVHQNGYLNELELMLREHNEKIADRIEWKTNDGGAVKVQNLIALSWIPLQLVDPVREAKDPEKIFNPSEFNETNMYSGKGNCLKQFERLMSSPDVSEKTAGDYTKDIINEEVKSAFNITTMLPELYDYIYTHFATLYNGNDGSFGRIAAVKKLNNTKNKDKKTPFSGDPIKSDINISPDGFIIPLFYGLQALLEKKEVNGKIIIDWATDPKAFLDKHLSDIMGAYKGLFSLCDYDPQKVGKAEQCYKNALNNFKMALMQDKISS